MKKSEKSPVAGARLVRLFLSERVRELRHAFRGEARFAYRAVRREGQEKIMTVGEVFATSIPNAIRKIDSKHSEVVIQGIRSSNRSVAVKLLVAYPCRLARWVFAYPRARNLELQDVDAVLRLQTGKAVVRNVDLGILLVDLPESANTP